MLRRFFISCCVVLIGSLGMAAPLLAADEPLPKAEAIIEKYLEVTGGKALYEKHHSEVSTGSMEFVGKGIKGTLTSYRAAPNKSYMVIEIAGIGKIEEGSDGQVAWSRSAMQGPRLKEGEEKAVAMRSSVFNAELHWRDHYKKAEATGVEDVDGQPCYKVVMTPNEGSPVTRFYHKKSSLIVKMVMTLKNPMGEFPVETLIGDYRKEGDILMPHKMQQKAAGQEIAITLDSVKHNVEIPKDRFDLPDDVKALLKK